MLAILLALSERSELELPAPSTWTDGVDAEGRRVVLVGASALRALPEGEEAIRVVLDSLAEGHLMPGVHAMAYQSKASEALATIAVAPGVDEVLVDGPRGSGKTQMAPAALAVLAELHARAGHPLPLRVLWLHDALVNASVKTARSLESPLWGGLWRLENDRHTAVFAVGGTTMVTADFVGTRDESAAERLRAESHVVAAEEVVPSLDESGGSEERKWELALTSARLTPNRRRIAFAMTNPGGTDSDWYRRFIEGGGRPGCVRCPVPSSDRMSPEQVAAERERFRDSPDLEARLALGEWSALRLGECVAVGYDPAIHVAPEVLRPLQSHVLNVGWDGGHSPSAVIGQLVNGQVRVYASLNDLKIGVLELVEDQVIPWLTQHAPWVRNPRVTTASLLHHVIDPSMKTGSEASIRESSEKVIRETLRGRIAYGAQPWPPRREAVLRVMAPRHEDGVIPLAISPVKETESLRAALASRWYYAQSTDGRVDRSRPKKPNSPWADLGDAFAYLCGMLRPGALGYGRRREGGPPKVIGAAWLKGRWH